MSTRTLRFGATLTFAAVTALALSACSESSDPQPSTSSSSSSQSTGQPTAQGTATQTAPAPEPTPSTIDVDVYSAARTFGSAESAAKVYTTSETSSLVAGLRKDAATIAYSPSSCEPLLGSPLASLPAGSKASMVLVDGTGATGTQVGFFSAGSADFYEKRFGDQAGLSSMCKTVNIKSVSSSNTGVMDVVLGKMQSNAPGSLVVMVRGKDTSAYASSQEMRVTQVYLYNKNLGVSARVNGTDAAAQAKAARLANSAYKALLGNPA